MLTESIRVQNSTSVYLQEPPHKMKACTKKQKAQRLRRPAKLRKQFLNGPETKGWKMCGRCSQSSFAYPFSSAHHHPDQIFKIQSFESVLVAPKSPISARLEDVLGRAETTMDRMSFESLTVYHAADSCRSGMRFGRLVSRVTHFLKLSWDRRYHQQIFRAQVLDLNLTPPSLTLGTPP